MHRIFYVFLFLFFSFSFLEALPVNQKNDILFWESQRVTRHLSRDLAFYLESELRWADKASEVYEWYVQPGILINLKNWFVIGPAYRHIRKFKDDFTSEKITIYNPILDIFILRNYREWKCENRSRFQYFIPEKSRSALLFRNRLQLITPWKWGKMEFNPYFSEEVFFYEYRGFSENRLLLGERFFPFCHFETCLYYMWRHLDNFDEARIRSWKLTKVIGLCFNLTY